MNQFLFSLVVGAFLGGAAGYLGHLMVSKRMALVGGALGHMTVVGITLGFLYGLEISLTSLLVLVVGVFLIWLFELRSRFIPTEALTGVVFASSVSIGFLLLPRPGIELAVLGDISRVGFWDGMAGIAVAIVVLLVHRRMCPKLTLMDISPDLARAQGVDVEKYHLAYLLSIALLVAFCVKIVGALLTAAIVVIPASAARNFSRNMRQYCEGAGLIGALTSVAGIIAHGLTGLPAGPLIILASTGVFLASLALKR